MIQNDKNTIQEVNSMNTTLIGPILATIGAFLLAVEMLMIRKATVSGKSFDAVLASIWINSLIFIPALFIFHGLEFQLTTTAIIVFALSSIFGTVLGRIVFYLSTKKIGASLTAPISQANLLVATIFSILVIGETITEGHFFGILILLAGVAVVSYEINSDGEGSGFQLDSRLILPLTTMLFFGLSTPLFEIGLNEGTPLLAGFALKSVVALFAVSTFSIYKGFSPVRPFKSSEKKIYLYAAIAQTIGYFLGFSALYYSRVVVVAPFQNIQPFFVLLLSFIFLGNLEEITPKIIIGAALTIGGAITIGFFM